jgi:hypothetical protein
MITFLSSPKPFAGIAKEHQYRAIRSWLAAVNDAEVILYGDSDGIDEAASDLGARVRKDIDSTLQGIPYFGAIALHASEHGKHDLQVYLNCDIILLDIQMALERVEFDQFLFIGQCIDLGDGILVNPEQGDLYKQLEELAIEGKATIRPPTAIDYFGFRRGMWSGVSPIIIGRGGYDNALLAHCMRQRIPIVDGTYVVTALHQFHEYSHMQGGVQSVMRGSDAIHNLIQAGCLHSATLVSDAQFVLKDSLVYWPCRGDWLRHLELKMRYKVGWLMAGLTLRLIWRVLQVIGITRVPQVALPDVVNSWKQRARRLTPELVIKNDH